MTATRTPAEQVAEALLAADPLAALQDLLPRVADPALRDVLHAAERRLGVVRLDPDGGPARLLRAVAGHPGLSAAELAGRTGLGDAFPAAARVLLDDGLVVSSRFERADCWSRTSRGAAALRLLGG